MEGAAYEQRKFAREGEIGHGRNSPETFQITRSGRGGKSNKNSLLFEEEKISEEMDKKLKVGSAP